MTKQEKMMMAMMTVIERACLPVQVAPGVLGVLVREDVIKIAADLFLAIANGTDEEMIGMDKLPQVNTPGVGRA